MVRQFFESCRYFFLKDLCEYFKIFLTKEIQCAGLMMRWSWGICLRSCASACCYPNSCASRKWVMKALLPYDFSSGDVKEYQLSACCSPIFYTTFYCFKNLFSIFCTEVCALTTYMPAGNSLTSISSFVEFISSSKTICPSVLVI